MEKVRSQVRVVEVGSPRTAVLGLLPLISELLGNPTYLGQIPDADRMIFATARDELRSVRREGGRVDGSLVPHQGCHFLLVSHGPDAGHAVTPEAGDEAPV